MTFDQFLAALRARWPLLVATWLGIVAVVAIASILLPPRYRATASLAVEMASVDLRGQQVFKPAGAVSTYLATQVDIMRSEEVALRAVHALGLEKQQEWRDKWQKSTDGEGSFEAWLAEQLLRKLDVHPSRDSNAVTLAFTSPDPQFSAAVANAFVKAYTDTTVQFQAAPARQFNAFFTERAKPLREALEQARARLSAYEKENGIAVGGDQPDVESARLAELNSQLITLQDEATEAASRRRQARTAPGDMREVRSDPEVAALTGELVRQQGNLADLKSEFGDRHQAVIQVRQSIKDTQRRLNSAMQRAAEGLGGPLKVSEGRLAEVRAAVERQRSVVLRRKSQRDAAAALVRDVDNAEKAYGAVLARASQTALESANTTQTNVSVLKSATPPLWSPAFLIRNTVIAAFLGLLLGIARLIFAERRDRRLRTLQDVTIGLRQPLLLALPDGWARDRENERRAEQTRRRLVSAQPRLAAPKWR